MVAGPPPLTMSLIDEVAVAFPLRLVVGGDRDSDLNG